MNPTLFFVFYLLKLVNRFKGDMFIHVYPFVHSKTKGFGISPNIAMVAICATVYTQ